MKKLLIIPDVHGIDKWKKSAADAVISNTHVVFLGDYVDSYIEDGWTIFENLKDIIEFKKIYSDKVTLLLGNHDYAYIYRKSAITGYNPYMQHDYRGLFEDNRDLFEVAWGYQGKDKYTLLTHAGLTNYFYNNIVKKISDVSHPLYEDLYKKQRYSKIPIHEMLNYLKDQVSLMWTVGLTRGGMSKSGSILWADKSELINDPFKGIDQIVGHTRIPCFDIINNDNDLLYFIDTHDEKTKTIIPLKIEL